MLWVKNGAEKERVTQNLCRLVDDVADSTSIQATNLLFLLFIYSSCFILTCWLFFPLSRLFPVFVMHRAVNMGSGISRFIRPTSLTRHYHTRTPVMPATTLTRVTSASLHKLSSRPFTSSASSQSSDSFLEGNGASYIEEMYEAWLKDPNSVHLSWQVYFKNMKHGMSPSQAYTPPPTLVPSGSARLPKLPNEVVANASDTDILDHMKIQLMVRAYQVRGHHIAHLDPLGILQADLQEGSPPELSYQFYGFNDKDLDRTFSLGPGILPGYEIMDKKMTLREIIQHLKKIYCKCVLNLSHLDCLTHVISI